MANKNKFLIICFRIGLTFHKKFNKFLPFNLEYKKVFLYHQHFFSKKVRTIFQTKYSVQCTKCFCIIFIGIELETWRKLMPWWICPKHYRIGNRKSFNWLEVVISQIILIVFSGVETWIFDLTNPERLWWEKWNEGPQF